MTIGRLRPTRRALALGFGALLLFGVGTNVQAGWVLVVAALLLGIAVAGLLTPIRALHGIEVERIVPKRVGAGEAIDVSLTVRNASGRLRGLIRASDDFCGRGEAVVDLLPSGGSVTFTGRRRAARRGVYEGGPCELTSGAPFGVLEARRTVEVSSPLVVHPRIYDARSWRRRGPAGASALASVGDVSSVRDYRPGDPLRHIHWRSVARRDRLVVREFDREAHGSLDVAAVVGADPDVADAVASVACSIALAALRDVEVSIGGRRVHTADAVLDWGARLAPDDRAPTPAGGEAGVVVVPVSLADADALRAAAATTSLSVVLIDDGAPSGPLTSLLRGAGADVAVVTPEAVGSWFEGGCIAS